MGHDPRHRDRGCRVIGAHRPSSRLFGGIGTALAAWALSRLIVFAAAIIGSAWLGPGHYGINPAVPRSLTLLGSWDVNWYLQIATGGYQHVTPGLLDHWSTYAFFPLLPLIMRLGVVTSTNPFVWGLVASNLALLVGLVVMQRLTAALTTARTGRIAVWVLAFSPAAVYASLAYTDALLLMVALAAALAAVRGRWIPAGLLAAVGTLARPQGALVAVLIVVIAVSDPGVAWSLRVRRIVTAVVPTVVFGIAFLAWMQSAHGSWTLPLRAQRAWGRSTPGPASIRALGANVWHIVHYPFQTSDTAHLRLLVWSTTVLELVAVPVLAVLLVALARSNLRYRAAWCWYSGLVLAVPLLSGSTQSALRFGLVAFPLAWPVARWLERRSGATRALAGVVASVVMVGVMLLLHFGPP